MTDLLGKRLGKYEILSVLGQGGMAIVYKARQESMDRDVAIKVIGGQLVNNPDFVTRFQREAKLIAKLQHPHILPVYDFGKEESLLFLVMRLVEGGSLDERLRHGALPIEQAARMFTQIASALSYAHDQGIIHRDLKPNNILLDTKNNPYLTDFGIAKLLEDNNAAGRLTATGTVMGTPSYMAPEQWRGESIDARTDIYALGIMLYEMITGDLPFKGETPYALMYKHFDALPPSPRLLKPDLPETVGQVIIKALAKDKDQRYASADLMAQDLNAALAGRAVNASINLENEPTFIGGPVDAATKQGRPTEHRVDPIRTAVGMDTPASPTTSQSSPTAGRLPLIVAIATVIILLGGGGLFFANRSNPTPTPSITPTEAVSILPTTAPTATATNSATHTPVPAIPTAVRFEDYSDQGLNIKFRIPAGFQVQKKETYGLFITEDFSQLKFRSDGIVTGPPYMQIAVGNSQTFGALEMAKAKTPMEAVTAYFGTEQLANLDQVFGTHFPAATTSRAKPELGVLRKLYMMILGPDRFAIVMVQAPPEQIDNINNNITLPLVRSLDFAVSPTQAVIPTDTATPTVVATFVMPTKFDTHESAAQSISFEYPANWELSESKTGIIISSTLGISANDLEAPPYITMIFKTAAEIRNYKPQYSIVDLYRDELGFMTEEGKALEGVSYPSAAGRSLGKTQMKINGWLILVQLDQDHYLTIFAQAPRGSEDAYLQQVLIPMLKSMKYTPK